MKRLQFIISTLGATLSSLIASKFKAAAKPTTAPTMMTWAERIAEDAERTHGRRYEHLLHAKYCHGSLDHLLSSEETASRQGRCAKICGLCRYINSLAVWPVPNYRRPPDTLLDELEEQQWCLNYQNQEDAWPSAYWAAQLPNPANKEISGVR